MSSSCLEHGDETPLANKKKLTTLGEVVSKATTLIADILSEKNLSLDQAIDEPTRMLFVDPDRIAEALCLLMRNTAYQCSIDGEITLRTMVGEGGHTEFYLTSSVETDSEEAQQALYHLETNTDAGVESSGPEFGLVRAKRIIELHEGEIWVNLLTGSGAEIGFYLSS